MIGLSVSRRRRSPIPAQGNALGKMGIEIGNSESVNQCSQIFPICSGVVYRERHRELFQSSPLINVFSIPGRCPGLELANAFGINTGQQWDVGESSMSLP